MDRLTNGQTDGRTDGNIDETQRDRQTGRQIDQQRTLVQENDPLRQNYFPAHFRDINGMKELQFSCRLSLYWF